MTALHSEARPLIEHFDLEKSTDSKRLDLFENDELKLIVSGIGKLRSAIATSYLLTRNMTSGHGAVINIGIGGSVTKNRPIGELSYVHKITDHATGREYFPEAVLSHDMPGAEVETFDKPVGQNEKISITGDLVDMEASGFYQASSLFVETHAVYCLKVVSDYLEWSHLSKEFVSGLIHRNMPTINRFFQRLTEFHRPEPELIRPEDQERIVMIVANLKLTSAQSDLLWSWCRSAKIRGLELGVRLEPFLQVKYKTKSENKDALERIRKSLHQ